MIDIHEYLRISENRQKLRDSISNLLGRDLNSVMRSMERSIDGYFRSSNDPFSLSFTELRDLVEEYLSNIDQTAWNGLDGGRKKLIDIQEQIRQVLEFKYPVDYQLLPKVSAYGDGTVREVGSILTKYRDGKLSEVSAKRNIKQRLHVPAYHAEAFTITQLAGFDNSAAQTVAGLSGLDKAMYWGSIGPNTREFCQRLLQESKYYTEEQIWAMDNGQGLPVLRYCGGYRCLHEWIWIDPSWPESKDMMRQRAGK